MKLVLAADRSHIKIRTFAEGFLSKLAHDLELGCRKISGTAERNGNDGTATVDVPIEGIEVNGVLKNGQVDLGSPTGFERKEILSKMRKEVFHARPNDNASVRAFVTVDAGKARVRVVTPSGREVTREVRFERKGDTEMRVSGSVSLSLQDIGSDVVKGPMNAFRVKDAVEVVFDVVFVLAS